MPVKNKKQFGVWMDSKYAIIAGRENVDEGDFMILGQVENAGASGNSNENAFNNQQITSTNKFFKEIAEIMLNVEEVHVTGTGQIQQQFMKFLASSPQYKNAVSSESTSNRMADEQLLAFMAEHFN